MSFASEAAKLLTNKYFLYFIAFLAASNVIGYLVSNKLNAVVFFVLVCILAYNFSKNMAVVLIIAIIATNLLMVNKSMREGFTEGEENMDTTTDTTDTTDATDTTTATDTDTMDDSASAAATPAPIKQAAQKLKAKLPAEQQEKINTAVANAKVNAEAKKAAVTGTTTTTEGEPVESFAPAGAGYNGTKRGAIGGPAKAARIDYSTTLEQAYDNLEKMLGSDGLNNLSADTNKLMSQQQKLFSTVDKMLPMIDKAQGMLAGLDMDKINSLVGITEKFSGIGSNISGGLGKLMGSTATKQ
jgi:uncharacterized protein YpmB